MADLFPPLAFNVPIVDPKTGNPSPQFQRLMQQLQAGENLTVASNGTVNVTGVLQVFDDSIDWGAGALYISAPILSFGYAQTEGAITLIPSATDVPVIFLADLGFNTSAYIGTTTANNRILIGCGGPRGTGYEFDNPPYVGTHKIFHEGNLAFGTGLTYAGGVLSASGSGGTPTVRSSSITSSSAASYTVAWPAGTVAGDVVFIFAEHGFAYNNPAGWTIFDNQSGSGAGGLTAAKVMTAGDIATGSVTLTTTGTFNGVLALVTVTGTTMAGIRQPFTFVRSGSGPAAGGTVPLLNGAAYPTDLILAFAGIRATGAIAFSAGFTSLQAVNAASASGAVGKFTGTLGQFGLNETASSAGAGSGYYTSVVALR
jgi:hypothetical protein